MVKLAILLYERGQADEYLCLARFLDFFGVPWKTVQVSNLSGLDSSDRDCVWFGRAETVAAALNQLQTARPAACYVYIGDARTTSERGLRALCQKSNVSLKQADPRDLILKVSREFDEVTGSMAGLELSLRLRKEDAVVAGWVSNESGFRTLISVGDDPVFVRFEHGGTPIFFCSSSNLIDIDEPVGQGFYDVKNHFCSVVPLVMFIRFSFPDVVWRCQELGACLIIDDPLLKKHYGFCDFGLLRDLMRRYGFTTNIAFIPWNWRRTSSAAAEFFKNEPERFSISIHGCDHIEAEFGDTSPVVLNSRAKLAQSRMQGHETRTGIHHDRVMVFPQGIFSSVSPAALKGNEFLAAVNTETTPADSDYTKTRIRDVWDVAIMRYGDFPIFTRRYAHHGLENFAFDCLLGKPCLIVAHHDFFKDNCSALVELIEGLQSLNCKLQWRSLGEVIRRACHSRVDGDGVVELEMYANELLLQNPSDRAMKVLVRKRECEADLVAEVQCDKKAIAWTSEHDHLVFEEQIAAGGEGTFRVLYREYKEVEKPKRSLRFELTVAIRRFLSEFRDDYLSRSGFLKTTAVNLKTVLTKAN